jgi:hypothetical protein
MIFKSTYQILNNPWKKDILNVDHNPKMVPPSNPWIQDKQITIDDVKIWEQIYYMPGNIGVYAAWDPFDDFYIIVYNLFSNQSHGIETFSGPDAATKISKKLSNLGIDIPTKTIWIK